MIVSTCMSVQKCKFGSNNKMEDFKLFIIHVYVIDSFYKFVIIAKCTLKN